MDDLFHFWNCLSSDKNLLVFSSHSQETCLLVHSHTGWLLGLPLSFPPFLSQSVLDCFVLFKSVQLDPEFSYLNYSLPQHGIHVSMPFCPATSPKNRNNDISPGIGNYRRRKLYSLGDCCQFVVLGGSTLMSPVFVPHWLFPSIGHLFQILTLLQPPSQLRPLTQEMPKIPDFGIFSLWSTLASLLLKDLDSWRSSFCQGQRKMCLLFPSAFGPCCLVQPILLSICILVSVGYLRIHLLAPIASVVFLDLIFQPQPPSLLHLSFHMSPFQPGSLEGRLPNLWPPFPDQIT